MIGYVYKIITHLDEGIIYVGSSVQKLSTRMSKHRTHYRMWKDGAKNTSISIFPYFDSLGLENFVIVELARYEVVDKQELHAREQLWISKLDCVNKNGSIKIGPVAKKHKQEWSKEYAEKNKDVMKVKRKEYKAKNAEIIKEKDKVYREENSERILQHKREYMADNGDKVKTWVGDYHKRNQESLKFYCPDCDIAAATRPHLLRHLQTQKHYERVFPIGLL